MKTLQLSSRFRVAHDHSDKKGWRDKFIFENGLKQSGESWGATGDKTFS